MASGGDGPHHLHLVEGERGMASQCRLHQRGVDHGHPRVSALGYGLHDAGLHGQHLLGRVADLAAGGLQVLGAHQA